MGLSLIYIYLNVLEQFLDKVFFFSLLLADRAIPKAQKISPPYSVTGKSQLLCNPAYSIQFYTTLIAKYFTYSKIILYGNIFFIFQEYKFLMKLEFDRIRCQQNGKN